MEENSLAHCVEVYMEEGDTAKNQLTQTTGLFCTVKEKHLKSTQGLKSDFSGHSPLTFLKNKLLWSNAFSYIPDSCSVWTSQIINSSKLWLQLKYSKREEYNEVRRNCASLLTHHTCT